MSTLSHPVLLVALAEVVIGIVLLVRAADEFVEGSANIAEAARVSPLVIGAVVVGFGTSAPELLISVIAALDDDVALGLGNIIGSNVANLSLVLAAAALVVTVPVSQAVKAREAPMSMVAVLAFAGVTIGGLARWEGVLLVIALVATLSWVVKAGAGYDGHRVSTNPEGTVAGHITRTMLGLVGVVISAQILVWGAMGVAREAGLSDGFIGFTLVAAGTSLPELVTAVTAARKKQTELLLGNLLGSNLFNSLAVGGAIALIAPGPIPDEGLKTVGVIVMAVVSVVAWLAMVTRDRVDRREGAVLLTAWLVAVALLARSAPVDA